MIDNVNNNVMWNAMVETKNISVAAQNALCFHYNICYDAYDIPKSNTAPYPPNSSLFLCKSHTPESNYTLAFAKAWKFL